MFVSVQYVCLMPVELAIVFWETMEKDLEMFVSHHVRVENQNLVYDSYPLILSLLPT